MNDPPPPPEETPAPRSASPQSTPGSTHHPKYDRQLRLWGAAGQEALGRTLVVLVGATAAGTETLKNLILPGVGSVCILDDAVASVQDQTSNFFVTSNSMDRHTEAPSPADDAGTPTESRAQIAMELLQELNPDVLGRWKHVRDLEAVDYDSLLKHLETDPDAHAGRTRVHAATHSLAPHRLLVIGSDVTPSVARALAQACHGLQRPFLLVQSYGLLGVVRLQTPPLPLLYGSSAKTQPDLRITRPFPALQQLADTILWDEMDDHQHAHVPYPLILLQALKLWRNERKQQSPETDTGTNAAWPTTWSEKMEFNDTLKAMSRNYDKELNFQQAVQFSYLAYASADQQALLPIQDLESLLEKTSNPTCHCPKLQLIVQAMLRFGQRRGSSSATDTNHPHTPPAPLHGSIPDMVSSTTHYVSLQRVYKQQAQADLEELRRIVLEIQQHHHQQQQRQSAVPTIADAELVAAIQNVHALSLYHPRSVVNEYNDETTPPSDLLEELQMAANEASEEEERPDQTPLLWYLGLQACRRFHQQLGRYPGCVWDNENYLQDVPLLQECLTRVLNHYQLLGCKLIQETLIQRSVEYCTELVRYANAEIHAIASVVGGVASQEAVKIITGQYVPIDNCYVYNGIASVAAVYKV